MESRGSPGRGRYVRLIPTINGKKMCSVCGKPKDLSEFTQRSDRDQSRTQCRACKNARSLAAYHTRKTLNYFEHKAARTRARASGLHVPCNVTPEYLAEIWTGWCPVLQVPINYGSPRSHEHAPELDRIVPSRGYVVGNVAWLSRKANRIKNNVDVKVLENLLSWLKGASQ